MSTRSKKRSGYYVIWRRKNGNMAEQHFARYWEAVQKKQALTRQGFRDVSMQSA